METGAAGGDAVQFLYEGLLHTTKNSDSQNRPHIVMLEAHVPFCEAGKFNDLDGFGS